MCNKIYVVCDMCSKTFTLKIFNDICVVYVQCIIVQ